MALLTQSVGGSNALKVTTYSDSGTAQLLLDALSTLSVSTDSSPNAWTITNNGSVTYSSTSPYVSGNGGSIQFSGTNSLSNTTANLSLASSSTPFTVEAWIYPTVITGFTGGTVCPIISIGNESVGRMAFGLSGDNSGQLGYNYYGFTNENLSSAGAIAASTWTHVAFVSDGTTVTGYVNGVSTGSFTIGSSAAGVGGNGNGFYVGGSSAGGKFTGRITNLRYVNGTAVYKGNFTPPTSQLTVVTGSAGTFTPQVSGGSFCRVILVGGGGGGGGASNSSPGETGGGAGATLVYWQYVTAPTTYTVGAGGAGGVGASIAVEGDGANGGTTSFGTLVAPGGQGGITYGKSSSGGLGGGVFAVPVSSVATTNASGYYSVSSPIVYTGFQNGIGGIAGGAGGFGGGISPYTGGSGSAPGFGQGANNGTAAGGTGTSNHSGGGGGGDSAYGNGGAGGQGGPGALTPGSPGTGYGAGGGGGGGTNTGPGSGGNGSGGLIIIEEFGAQG